MRQVQWVRCSDQATCRGGAFRRLLRSRSEAWCSGRDSSPGGQVARHRRAQAAGRANSEYASVARTVRLSEEAGAEWLAEQGFDRKE